MNGVIKQQLGLNASIVWGAQSGATFSALSGDFMIPVTDVMDRVLTAGKINVTVYEGQVDLICGTMGAERWMQRLQWAGMPNFYSTPKTPFYVRVWQRASGLQCADGGPVGAVPRRAPEREP